MSKKKKAAARKPIGVMLSGRKSPAQVGTSETEHDLVRRAAAKEGLRFSTWAKRELIRAACARLDIDPADVFEREE